LINLLPQLPRDLERHHPPGSQHHVLAVRRVPATPFFLFIYTEFAEPTDKDVLPGCQGRFDGFDELFDHFGALFLGESEFLIYVFNDVCLGQGHFGCPLRARWVEFVDFVKNTGFEENCQ